MSTELQTTETFSSRSTEMARTETASAAVAAQAKAAVEARYVMALQRPRNWDDVRTKLLKECKRPSFAATALYHKPIGGGITGFSIRFVEAALRCMTNVLPEVITVYDDPEKKIVRVTVTDLEANLTYSKDTTITKTVERSKPESDGTYLSVRTNSYGKPVYTIRATDDEILNKENAIVSKAIRTLGLRLVPGDLQDESEELIHQVSRNKAAQDPDAERKRVIDAFSNLGVSAMMLTEHLGQDLGTITPAQLVELRALHSALKEGETSWREVIDEKLKADPGAAPTPAPKGKGASNVKKKVAAKSKEKAAPAASPSLAELLSQIEGASCSDELDEILDAGRDLPAGDAETLDKAVAEKRERGFS